MQIASAADTRYIQYVESEQWLGSLIHANEELVNALMAFEVLDKSVEDDSDSEDDEWNDDHPTTVKDPGQRDAAEAFAGLRFDHGTASAKQSRPGMSIPMPPSNVKGRLEESEESSEEEEDEVEEEDENDPFADRNAVQEAKVEARDDVVSIAKRCVMDTKFDTVLTSLQEGSLRSTRVFKGPIP
jgi:hypothetical protein